MTPDRWRQVTGIFHGALAHDTAARGAYLLEACGNDESLRAEVLALLAGHEQAGSSDVVPQLARAHATEPLPAGTRLGPYEVGDLLGAGGMGEVYRARDVRLGRSVAVKVLTGTVARDPRFRDRFEREARAISTLAHPNICTLFDIGDQNGTAPSFGSASPRIPIGAACAEQRFDSIRSERCTGLETLHTPGRDGKRCLSEG